MTILDDKKSSLRELERKADKISIRIAKKMDLPKLWSFGMIDLEDPFIATEYAEYKAVMDKYNELYWEVARLENDLVNPRMNFDAKKKVTDFLDELGTSRDACEFLQSIHMTTHELIEAVAYNPEFMDGVFL